MKKRHLPQAKLGRSCGQCNECCTAVGVPELEKPMFTECAHVVDHKCGCYAARPDSCRGYKCLWLQGGIDGPDRPDRVGVIFDWTDDTRRLESPGVHVITARVTRLGPDATRLIEQLSDRFVVIVRHASGEVQLAGDREAVETLRGRFTR